MSKILFAIALLLAGARLASAASAELPIAMQGSWSMGDDHNNHERVPDDQADFYVDKTKYSGVDSECEISEAKKLSNNRYLVRAHCQIADDPAHQWDDLVEFELRGDVLHLEDITS